MNSKITHEEMIAHKDGLEKSIRAMILQFEDMVGHEVHGIDISRFEAKLKDGSQKTYLGKVTIKAIL